MILFFFYFTFVVQAYFFETVETECSGVEELSLPGVDLFKLDANISIYSQRVPHLFTKQITYGTETWHSANTERAIFVLIHLEPSVIPLKIKLLAAPQSTPHLLFQFSTSLLLHSAM